MPGDPLTASRLKVTRPRRTIADILYGNSYRHFTAEEIMAAAPRLSLATLYNTLNDFAARALVQRIATSRGRTKLDTGSGDHHHFHVEMGNLVIDIPRQSSPF